MQLTEEQQAIVQHDEGAARVFAVAGAGKTTAMVHRIHRLVQEKIFAPSRILATSFSRASVSDIERALSQWSSCRAVKHWTLHKLGFYIIRRARQLGYYPIDLNSRVEPDQVYRTVLFQAIAEARRLNLDCRNELDDLDQEDFLAYVSRCKGNLHYANLKHSNAPQVGPHARIAQQADPPLESELAWYLELYQVFEEIRQRTGGIGFDDMLMTSWELLANYDDLLAEIQDLFDCVIVDEFQDVNRAQFAMLDLITEPHRNYMVIGDDDQTIYEWRGASARFILDIFDKRYQPTTYTITDNFRCQATQVVLANAVIQQNRQRYPKRLSLTQGFSGQTQIHESDSSELMGQAIAAQVGQALQSGHSPTDIAILVRVYAQTPYIEQYLIKAQIPYWGPDLVPFYRRTEITNFLAFAQFARAEVSPQPTTVLTEIWNRIKTIPPLRYLNRELKQEMQAALVDRQASMSQILPMIRLKVASSETVGKLERLSYWLSTATQTETAEVALRDLDRCLGYRDYLRHHSGFSETGQGKAAGVEALMDYAQGKGSLLDFLQYLEEIHLEEQKQSDQQRCIRLTTIHQAKGLEWPIVIVPHCNQGFIPFGDPQFNEELEEERRLLYVAITRSKQHLHLHLLSDKEPSQFLREANYKQTLQQINRLQDLFTQDPETWVAQDILSLLLAVQNFQLGRYFSHWWAAEPYFKEKVASQAQQFIAAAKQRDLLTTWKLNHTQMELWRNLFAIVESYPTDFPGLEELVQKQQQRQRSQQPTNTLFRVVKAGDRVRHEQFGVGKVAKVIADETGDVVTVVFRQHGEKKILVTEHFCALELA